jgi:ferrochelatase
MTTSNNKHNTIGLLLMAYGSPENLNELGPYLLDIRGGRPTSPELVAEITERYRLIGGRSPLLSLTKLQASALETELNHRNETQARRFQAYLGMRHWDPRIKVAVAQIINDDIRQVVGLVMAPHSSQMSTGAYFARLGEAMQELGADFDVIRIENWHDHPGLIAALAEKALAAKALFGDVDPCVIFSVHSLPERILEQGDPYDAQLHETAGLLAQKLALPAGRWQFCYQSAGQSAERWLGPPIEHVVTELSQSGEKNLLVVPIGFVCDHVEVLYDIDIVCRNLAEIHDARLERSESLNYSPTFINALADLVTEHLLAKQEKQQVDSINPSSR